MKNSSVPKNKRRLAAILILLLALLFIGVGLSLDQQVRVMNKAIRICLECVGIG